MLTTTIAIVCSIFLVVAVVFAGFIRAKRERYIRQIRALRRKRLDAEMALQDNKAELTLRRTRIETLRKELESLEVQRDRDRIERSKTETPARSALDILKDMGRLNDADIKRATDYLEKTKSESSVEEALVILGIVAPEDMNGAVRDAKAFATEDAP